MISKLGKGTCAPARGGTVDLEPELRAFRLEEAQRAATRRQEQLETLFSISVGEPLTAVAISAGLANKGVPKLMIGAGASGSLFLFDQNGTLALTHPPDEKPEGRKAVAPEITAIVIGSKEDPFVAVSTRAGHVLVYNLTLPRAKIGLREATSETKLTLAARVAPLVDASGEAVPVLALDTYKRGRKTMLAVGDAAGAMRLYWRNGTQRSEVQAGGAVHAMERGGANSAIIAVGARREGIKLFDMGKPKDAPMRCEGSEPGLLAGGEVVSVAWDVQLSQLLYAGSRDGVISVFNTKARTKVTNAGEFENETKMVTRCKLVTSIRGHHVSPLALASLKGYLFSASSSLLVAHNVSGLYSRTRDEPNVVVGRMLPDTAFRPTVLRGTRAGHVVVGSGSIGELTLIASKLAFKTADESESGSLGFWGLGGGSGSGVFRNPLLLGGVMFVVFWQSSKFMGRKGGSGADLDMQMLRGAIAGGGMGRGSDGMGGRSAFDEAFREFGRGVPDGGGSVRGRLQELDGSFTAPHRST